MKVKPKRGHLEYQIVKYENGYATFKDPHTGEKFVLPNVVDVLKTAGYKKVKKK